MKILFYTPTSLEFGGGVETWLFEVAPMLRRKYKHNITVVDTDSSYRHELDQDKIELRLGDDIERYTVKMPLESINIFVPHPLSIIKVWKLVRNSDVVYYVADGTLLNSLIVLIRFTTKRKVIVGYHVPLSSDNFWKKLDLLISRHVLFLLDIHHVINKTYKNILEDWGFKNVFYISNGINTKLFKPIFKRHKDELRFLFVGRLEKQKGIDLLLRGIEIFLKENGEGTNFDIVGSGSLTQMVESFAKRYRNVKYYGYLDNMTKSYQEHDILIAPSRQEPFGLALIEAQSCGLPVICSKTAGPLEIITEKETGFFLESIDPESIAQSIQRVYDLWKTNPTYLERMGKNARQNVVERFSIEKTVNRLNLILEK